MKKPKDKYPYLWGCYVDAEFFKSFSRQYLQATVEISHYKGAMLLRVLPERPKKGEKHHCSCPSIQYPAAWLKGDDLDTMIKMLREAKSVWLKAYRKAEREHTKRGNLKAKKTKAKKKAPKRRMHLSAGGTDWSHDD